MYKRIILFSAIIMLVLSGCGASASGDVSRSVLNDHKDIIQIIDDCFNNENCNRVEALTKAENRLDQIDISSLNKDNDEGMLHALTKGLYFDFSLYSLKLESVPTDKNELDQLEVDYKKTYDALSDLITLDKFYLQ